jgi:orotidine-5'-phosphate decarboxylase
LGKEFFTAHGPPGVRKVLPTGTPLFLDLKFHDIPNTVSGAVRAALALQPQFLTVHASGGGAMLAAAAEAAAAGKPPSAILAVTVLTSLDAEDLAKTGINGPLADQVQRLARLAQTAGCAGVVCAANEIAMLRQACGPNFKLVVPGIRPADAAADDQKRVVTAQAALQLGADYLVIGRPITWASDPKAAARSLANEVAAAAVHSPAAIQARRS